jgi:hypothetical protein
MSPPAADAFRYRECCLSIETSLQKVAWRSELARRIVVLLREDPRVTEVRLYGSMAEDRADRYSDIDLVAHVRGVSDRELAEALPGLIDPIGPRMVDGWGLGFLPDTYIRTFYFSDYPLFWHVDIGCLSDTHVDRSDIKAAYHWPQIFKIWIDVVKDLLRGEDRVEYLAAMIARWADLSTIRGTPEQRLSQFLDLSAERARSRGAPYEAFYERCDELRREFLISL